MIKGIFEIICFLNIINKFSSDKIKKKYLLFYFFEYLKLYLLNYNYQ